MSSMQRNASSSESQDSVEIQRELDDLADVLDDLADVDHPDTQTKVKKRPVQTLSAIGTRKPWFPPDGIFTLAPKDSALSAFLFALYVACCATGIVCLFVA
jgi:hypothetical protein